ncbi:heavy metal-associated domain-containing protein [Streptococcus iniae]
MTQRKTIFELKGMDCPSEEQLVRIVLGNFEKVQTIKVNLAKNQVAVTHQEDSQKLLEALDDLKLQTQLVEDFTVEEAEATDTKQMLQKFILGQVLIINIAFFILEELYWLLLAFLRASCRWS